MNLALANSVAGVYAHLAGTALPGDSVRRFLFAILLLFSAQAAAGQQFSFPGGTGLADERLPQAMVNLAHQALAIYREDDRDKYLGILFRLQLVAGQYADARETIRALRKLRAGNGIGQTETLFVQYEIYAEAKARQSPDVALEAALQRAFHEIYGGLDDKTAYRLLFSFGATLAPMSEELRKALELQQGQGTITLAAALDLIRKYQVYECYKTLLPHLETLVAQDDAQRYLIDRTILVPTPDGARIAAMTVRPKREAARWPTLLGFTIYANDDWSFADAKKAAAYGYAGVVAYSRGKGRSPDQVAPFERDGSDASATIEWIARQTWSDGRVGMYGGSYNGFTQWAAAKRLPKALKAMMTSATAAPGIDVPMQGNIFLNFMYPWPFYTTNNKMLDDTSYDDPKRWETLNSNWYLSGKPYRELDRVDGTPNPLFRKWLDHPDYDLYWQNMIPYRQEFAAIGIPVLATTGYFDGAQVGALYYFNQHRRYNPKADHTLLVGPFEHLSMQTGVSPVVEGYEIDPVASIDLQELRYQWFDHVFKAGPKPPLLRDKVNYQVMGANVWKHAASLEGMANRKMRLYLNADQARTEAASGKNSVIQRIDFSERGDAAWTPSPLSITKVLDTHNGVAFHGAPLGQSIEVSGRLSGRLDFSINKRDVDLSVTLYELSPDGSYFQLLRYMGRASYARDRSHRQLLVPGMPHALTFKGESLTSRKMSPGSRLVVVLGVNKQPDMQINYGSGKDVSAESIADAGSPLEIRWHNTSYVDVPIGE